MKIYPKKTLILGSLVIVIASAVFVTFQKIHSDNILGKPLLEVRVHPCSTVKGGADKCFDLTGKAYVVNSKDTEKIADMLARIVISKHLTDNKDFRLPDSKALAKAEQLQIAKSKDEKIAGTFIPLYYSGGLFGDYSFPYSSDGHALYVSSFSIDGHHSDSDYLYAINSEFDTSDAQAQLVLKKAKELPSGQYILLVAE